MGKKYIKITEEELNEKLKPIKEYIDRLERDVKYNRRCKKLYKKMYEQLMKDELDYFRYGKIESTEIRPEEFWLTINDKGNLVLIEERNF